MVLYDIEYEISHVISWGQILRTRVEQILSVDLVCRIDLSSVEHG